MLGVLRDAGEQEVINAAKAAHAWEFISQLPNGLRATALCPGEVATPILKKRPVEPTAAEKARMLQEDEMGKTIHFIAAMPPHVCINELVITPVWNRIYVGGADIARKQ